MGSKPAENKTVIENSPRETLPSKKLRIAVSTPDPSTNLFSRPISEPPIFSYDALLEFVAQTLKAMREHPHRYHPDPGLKITKLSFNIQFSPFTIYEDWAHHMFQTVDQAGKEKVKEFYDRLLKALEEDHKEEMQEYESFWWEYTHTPFIADVGTPEVKIVILEVMHRQVTPLELSDCSEAYMTAEE